jgi:AGCS family alanine or glycine:cation symporter
LAVQVPYCGAGLPGVFGISTKYAEGLLAIKYRVKTEDGRMMGGPMYALERGLGWKWLAILFALFTAVASLGIGNTVQANSISLLAHETFNISPYITGAVICALTATVIIGGVKWIARVCTAFVPIMAVFYVVGCIAILCINYQYLGATVTLIVKSAFTPMAAGGGFIGTTVMMAARFGIARGLVLQRVRYGFGAYRSSRSPHQESSASGVGVIHRHILGHSNHLRPHRTCPREQHHRLSRHFLS